MPLKEIILPAMGEGITDATIIRWLVDEGDSVKQNQPMVEIATDKVDSEIPSPVDGKLKKIFCLAGSIPKIGETIALLSEAGSDDDLDDLPLNLPINPAVKSVSSQAFHIKNISRKATILAVNKAVDYSVLPFIPPYVRLVANYLNINLFELSAYYGLKSTDAINKRHIEEYLAVRENTAQDANVEHILDITALKTFENQTVIENEPKDYGPNIEPQEMSRMRKLIANQMVKSSHTIPHVTSYIEVDITELVQWRNKIKSKFDELYKTKLTLTPIFVKAIVLALKKYPEVNVSLDGDTILYKKEINIGMATVLPDKNLIVPVIKNADTLNLQGLAQTVNDLSARARSGELLPTEIMGSTFTFTNIGVFGTLTGTPIINHPEAAILAIGSISKKPFVVNTPQGQSIGIRDVVMLSLAYDHRVIDGSLGGLFLKEVSDALTTGQINLATV